jgi:hypothetical protein
MATITIPLDTPAERPEVPSKTYNEIYIMDLAISSRSMGEQDSIYVEYVPYDQATGDRLLSDRREVRLPFWEAVQAIPSAANAFAAVALSLPDLIAYQTEKHKPVEPVVPAEPEPEPAPVVPAE